MYLKTLCGKRGKLILDKFQEEKETKDFYTISGGCPHFLAVYPPSTCSLPGAFCESPYHKLFNSVSYVDNVENLSTFSVDNSEVWYDNCHIKNAVVDSVENLSTKCGKPGKRWYDNCHITN